MRLLLDQNLDQAIIDELDQNVFDAVHTRQLGLSRARDEEIMEFAVREDRVVVSQDTDFGSLLAFSRAAKPSYVLIRRSKAAKASEIAALLSANLPAVARDLEAGATVSLSDDSLRVRRHPYGVDS